MIDYLKIKSHTVRKYNLPLRIAILLQNYALLLTLVTISYFRSNLYHFLKITQNNTNHKCWFLSSWFSVSACDTPEKDIFCRGCYGSYCHQLTPVPCFFLFFSTFFSFVQDIYTHVLLWLKYRYTITINSPHRNASESAEIVVWADPYYKFW